MAKTRDYVSLFRASESARHCSCFHISRNTLRAWLMAAGQEQSTIEETLHDVPPQEIFWNTMNYNIL
ncbi:MAG: hypothetical protein IPL35_07650 [Sphingobacteriales bacterium]|nr:hypothetical protein [Sphingobacteriales bacterium]